MSKNASKPDQSAEQAAAAEKAEQERLQAEQVAAQKAEQERVEAEQAAAAAAEKAEQARLEAEQLAREKAEVERMAAEKAAAAATLTAADPAPTLPEAAMKAPVVGYFRTAFGGIMIDPSTGKEFSGDKATKSAVTSWLQFQIDNGKIVSDEE